MGVFKRKNKDGIERDTWYVDYRDPDGKRVIKAVGLKKEAETYLGKVRASIREGRFFDVKKENKTTFRELLDAYVEKVREQRFYQTSVSYFVPVLKKRFEGKLLSGIDYKALEDFRDERKKTPTHHGITFNGIFSSAEVLLPEVRQFLEETFRRRVFNRYVTKELDCIACECEVHTGLHISAENNHVEVLSDAGQPTRLGEIGNIIVAKLNNLGMPSIRYGIEDTGTWYDGGDCPCGHAAPMMGVIHGRSVDTFKTRNGAVVSANFAGNLLTHPSIKQFQIVQKSFDLIIVRLVKFADIPQSVQERFVKTIEIVFGEKVTVQFEFPERIPVLPSGKHRYAISEVKRLNGG